MPAVTPSFLLDFESKVQRLVGGDYERLASNLWWPRIVKTRTTGARRDVLTWLLDTAQIRYGNQDGGRIRFDDLVSNMTEIEHQEANAGLRLHKHQFEDTDGDGLELGSEWARQIGAYMAYWPQKQATRFLKEAHNVQTVSGGVSSGFTAYDGLAFFAKNHPLNPYNPNAGTYANLLDGAAASTPSTDAQDADYPGGCPIDASVTLDVAYENLAKVFGYISGLKAPNGEDPRYIAPVGILAGPKLSVRVNQLMNAKFIAQAATGGGAGASDVEGYINFMGFEGPIMAHELAGFESNKTYFVVAKQVQTNQLGGVVYTEREPFKIGYYNGSVDAVIGRTKIFEWQLSGRNSIAPGHPYLIFKVTATTT